MSHLLLFAAVLTAWMLQPAAKEPTIRDAMKTLNGGPNSLHTTLGKDLKDQDPDWEVIQEDTARYVKQTEVLLKNRPKKGEAASWEALARAYNINARALDAAAKRKDARAAAAVLKRMSGACMTCHKAHKPE